MKKNIKKTQGSNKTSNYNSGIELPEVINMDSLCFFDDDSLDRLHSHLQAEREKVARYTEDLLPWEVEICYVQREMKIRNVRRIAHEKYVRNNPDAYYYDTAPSQDEFEHQAS
jgi:hypothetical protein